MTQRQLDIADMQCWILRMAQVKWNMPARVLTDMSSAYMLFEAVLIRVLGYLFRQLLAAA